LRDSRGQSLTIVAILVPLLIGVAALAVDVGNWYVQARKAQAAADAAALAAAPLLDGTPNECSAATTAAQNSLTFNMPTAALAPAPICPYDPAANPDGVTNVTAGSAYMIKVYVSQTAQTYLAKLFGFGSITVKKSAIAARAKGLAPEGIFANGGPHNPETPGASCGQEKGGFYEKGNNAHINGAIVSNGTFQIVGTGNTATGGSYHYNVLDTNPTDCVPAVANGNLFGGTDAQPSRDPNLESFPVTFSCTPENATGCIAQFDCSTYSSDPVNAPPWVHFAATAVDPMAMTDPMAMSGTGTAPQNWDLSQSGAVDQHGTTIVVNGALVPGVYCNTALAAGGCGATQCHIQIKNNESGGLCNSGCNVTFVADKVEMYQPGAIFTPYQNNVVAFGVPQLDTAHPPAADCTANNEIHFSADNASWTGILYAPCGDIEFGQGASSSGAGDDGATVDNVSCTNCLIEGRYVEILGNNFTMNNAVGPPVPAGQPKLVG
jgi:hypothetical protein